MNLRKRSVTIDFFYKDDVTVQVKVLLEAKADYKNLTGKDYAPPSDNKKKSGKENNTKNKKESIQNEEKMAPVSNAANASPEAEKLLKSISDQGEQVRTLKSAAAPKVFYFFIFVCFTS